MAESVIEERPSWILAVNRNQDLLGKTILVLRRDCTAVVDIDGEEWVRLHCELQRLVPVLDRLFRPDQVNFAFLMNVDAQVHLHVVPRYSSPRRWHGMDFADAHWGTAFGHEQRHLEPSELATLAGEVREQLTLGSAS